MNDEPREILGIKVKLNYLPIEPGFYLRVNSKILSPNDSVIVNQLNPEIVEVKSDGKKLIYITVAGIYPLSRERYIDTFWSVKRIVIEDITNKSEKFRESTELS